MRVRQSVCGSSAINATVYLHVERTCASTKRKTGQEVSSAKRLAVLVQDASMRGAVVNRVCMRQLKYATRTVICTLDCK